MSIFHLVALPELIDKQHIVNWLKDDTIYFIALQTECL